LAPILGDGLYAPPVKVLDAFGGDRNFGRRRWRQIG
jgi:hypothetical protein